MRMILIQQDTSEIEQKAKFWAGPPEFLQEPSSTSKPKSLLSDLCRQATWLA
jgi:hypothetical protein